MIETTESAEATDILVISDGKAGHLNQSLGLAEALRRRRPTLTVATTPALSLPGAVRAYWVRDSKAPPQLLIGAGHGTHATMVSMRRPGRCRSIVLMRPSLPLSFFDLSIEPQHDGGEEGKRRWLSQGALNRMQPGPAREDRGVILIGGPSPHYVWDTDRVIAQLQQLCDGSARWTLSDSRRTPEKFLDRLGERQLPGLEILPMTAQPRGWLSDALPRVARCWISPDSASMVYEALTAGADVGVLSLQSQARSRVASGVAQLLDAGLVTDFDNYAAGAAMAANSAPLAEADRCAERILALGWLR